MATPSRSRSELVELDRRYLWRPFTSSIEHEEQDPIVVARAEGVYLWDADGRRYIDGNASWWTANLGHGHPRLRAAINRQAETLMHCTLAGVAHEPAARLAEELAQVAPSGLERAFYSDNGSTSVEVALKMAIQYWRQRGEPQRDRFITLPRAYHGDTVGAMAVGGVDEFRALYAPLLFDVLRAPEPDSGTPERDWANTFAWIEETLQQDERVAAVIIEPLVQGAAGMRAYPASYLTGLRKATLASGSLLIADEVFTGFGRTGRMWACDHAKVTPDILCTAKGLSGGVLPFAATLATGQVYDAFRGDKTRALLHGHTFCGNPLGAALGREVLAIYREEGILESLPPKAAQIADTFARLAEQPGVQRTRSLGMIGAVDLCRDDGAVGDYFAQQGRQVARAAREQGVYLRPLGNTVYITPSLTITQAELQQLLDVLEQSVTACARERRPTV